MGIAKKFLSKVRHYTTLKQPNMYSDYASMQQDSSSVSERFVQKYYGPIPESEHQKPYENPDWDYSQLEYNWRPWDFPWYNPPPFDPRLKDDDSCEAFWKRLFGDVIGFAVTQTVAFRLNLMKGILEKFIAKCPVEYIGKKCCKRGLRIRFNVAADVPEVKTGESLVIIHRGGAVGCWYEQKVDRGSLNNDVLFRGGEYGVTEYRAPDTPGDDWHYVYPYLSDDRLTICMKKKIKVIEGGNAGECNEFTDIGYTSQQMNGGEEQTLTAIGSGTFTWTVTDQSGQSCANNSCGTIDPTGPSVTYKAPSANANCAILPKINLYCNGELMASLNMYINIVTGVTIAGRICTYCRNGLQSGVCSAQKYYNRYLYCDGTTGFIPEYLRTPCGSGINGACTLDNYQDVWLAQCLSLDNCTFIDDRTTAQKAAGCCPEAVMIPLWVPPCNPDGS